MIVKLESLNSSLTQENLVVLCKDKHGSRVVDTLWRQSEVARKEGLGRLLLTHEEELSSDFHGSIVLRNCNITHLKKRQAGWLEQQRAAERKRELFQDLLEGGGQSSAGGSKRKRQLNDSERDETVEGVTRTKRHKKMSKSK